MRAPALLGAFALAATAVAVPRAAYADHDGEERIIEQTAYTLPRGRFQLGLLRQEWGPLDRLTVGTYALPWILRIFNGHVKWRFVGDDPVSLAVTTGIYRITPEALESGSGDATVTAVPVELTASWRISGSLTVSPASAYTVVTLRGSYDPANLEGVAAVSNLQVMATLEWRLTTVTALVLHGRYLVFQNAGGRASSRLHPDAFTTVEVQAVATSDELDFPQAFSLVPSVVFSWGVFNLRLGVGYGNYTFPGVNLVLPNKHVIPDLDLYFRF